MSKVLIAGIGGGKNKQNGKYNIANYQIENNIYRIPSGEAHFSLYKTRYRNS